MAVRNTLPTKLEDSRSFTILYSIGGVDVEKTLYDLGANINLMPLYVFKRLKIEATRPTTVTLHLADRSIKYPKGKIKDVLVKVDKFVFPTDFIIQDYKGDSEVPIILGSLFLVTGQALIDVKIGELTK